MAHWQTSRFLLDLTRPLVMGIVNTTPDSFSDGGRFADPAAAIAHCERLLAEGADLLDIGGESTRPGARTPSTGEELDRVMPVLRHAVGLGVPVSVDTSDPVVMKAALEIGVDVVNDVRALRRPGAVDAVASFPRAGVCLMHMQGEPGSMQQKPHYVDVVSEVMAFFVERARTLLTAGISGDRISIDPGIGFGKEPAHNLHLLAHQRELLAVGYPLLVGWSRKSTLGVVTGRPIGERLAASVAAALIAVQNGASIVRVHDVASTVDALKLWQAVQTS